MRKRLHIVGCPRSGTTLLMELMATCFQSDSYCEHEVSIFDPEPITDGLYISKKPSDIKNLQHIYSKDSQLFIIYLVRDPRSVISSIHHSNTEQYFCNFKAWQACNDAAQQYLPGNRFGHINRFLQLRYEDLVADPDAVQAKIKSKFPFLILKHPFSEFEKHAKPSSSSAKAMNGLRSVNKDSLQGWTKHLPRVKEQHLLRPELAEDLITLGYEKDRQWLTMLEDIEAQVFPCRYSESPEYLKETEKALRMYFRSRNYLKALKK